MMKFRSKQHCDELFANLLIELENVNDHIATFTMISGTFGDHFALSTSFGGSGKEDFLVYRVSRQYLGLEEKLDDPASFSYNPHPNLGRANLKNKPVFYCSFSARTAIDEVKENKDEVLYISTWKINGKIVTDAFSLLYDSVDRTDFLREKVNQRIENEFPKKQADLLKYMQQKITDLFTYKGDKYYNISSAIAHKLLYNIREQGIAIPLLIYPSVSKKSIEYNFAMHPSFVNDPNCFRLVSVIKCNLAVSEENKLAGDILSKAVLRNKKLKWVNIHTKIKEFDFQNIKLSSDKDDNWIQVDAGKIKVQFNKTEYCLKDYLSTNYIDNLTFDENIDLNEFDIFDSSTEYIQKRNLIIEFDSNFRIMNNEYNHLKYAILNILIGIEFK